jgi:hypothetical protein
MRRVGGLFEQIVEWGNLRLACGKALRGKRSRSDAQEFVRNLDENLRQLQDGLIDGQLRVGESRQFIVFDPKQRTITAPCFRERVLHHAVMNVCESVFERYLTADTFACRIGKGRLACIARATDFSRRHPFFLKMDVRRYFESIPHEILVRKLTRLFRDPPLLLLLERIIDSHHVQAGRGLPIGSLTSQHFANFYLSFLDRFLKETVRVPGYVRYMDDSVVWGESPRWLMDVRERTAEYLVRELDVTLKENAFINRTSLGMDFLGVRVFPDHLRLSRRSKVRYVRKLRRYERQFLEGKWSERELQRRVEALTAFLRTPGMRTWNFRRTVIEKSLVGGHRASTALSAAAAGTTTARTAGRRTGTGTSLATATTTQASASP